MVWYYALVPIVKKSLNTPSLVASLSISSNWLCFCKQDHSHRFFLTLHYQKTQESQNYSHRFTCNPLAIWTGSKRTITKAQLATRDFNSRYSKTHDYNIGYKLISIAYPPSNCYASSSITFHPLMLLWLTLLCMNSKKRRIARNGDLIVCEKAYYSYRNYSHGIRELESVPLIFFQS